MARQRLCPDAEARGLTLTGAHRAVVLTSALAHYSVEKAPRRHGDGTERFHGGFHGEHTLWLCQNSY
jgi:hypothetical protein